MINNGQYLDGMTVVRSQSPNLGYVFQDMVIDSLKTLLEQKSLYQNVHINEKQFNSFADSKYPLAKLISEFKKRPIYPVSRNEGSGITAPLMYGADPLGTPTDEMSLYFILPNILIECRECGNISSFLSIASSVHFSCSDPYPIIADETEQVYTLYYRCATCRKSCVVFQVFRKGLRLQLTGRSLPYRPSMPTEWPKNILKIIEDSMIASNEGDIAAGYYHLRTALEFHIKTELGIPITDKIDGTELCDKYNQLLNADIKSRFSLTPLYTELSKGMHSREVVPDRLCKMMEMFLDHIKAKMLFSKYQSDK